MPPPTSYVRLPHLPVSRDGPGWGGGALGGRARGQSEHWQEGRCTNNSPILIEMPRLEVRADIMEFLNDIDRSVKEISYGPEQRSIAKHLNYR